MQADKRNKNNKNNKATSEYKPARPARSIAELRRRRRQQGKVTSSTQTPVARLIATLLTAVLYGFGGLLLDLGIAMLRAIAGIGQGDIFWLFAPVLLILGFIIGLIDGKNAGADSMEALPLNDSHQVDDLSLRHDLFRGLGIGIVIFAIFWLVMMLLT